MLSLPDPHLVIVLLVSLAVILDAANNQKNGQSNANGKVGKASSNVKNKNGNSSGNVQVSAQALNNIPSTPQSLAIPTRWSVSRPGYYEYYTDAYADGVRRTCVSSSFSLDMCQTYCDTDGSCSAYEFSYPGSGWQTCSCYIINTPSLQVYSFLSGCSLYRKRTQGTDLPPLRTGSGFTPQLNTTLSTASTPMSSISASIPPSSNSSQTVTFPSSSTAMPSTTLSTPSTAAQTTTDRLTAQNLECESGLLPYFY